MPAPDPLQYDVFADEFDVHAEDAPYNAWYDRPATLALLGEVGGRRVLDAACGPGFYLDALVRGGAEPQGCDASPRMVELARARTCGEVDVRVHDLDAPFDWVGDDVVDVVLCALAYHYLNDRPAFLREARRVLRPGGRLVISTHHATSDWLRLGGSYFSVEPVTETWHTGWTVTAWRTPLTVLTEEFADAGFVIARLVEPRPDPGMAERYPREFERLATSPGFVCFDLRPA